MTAPDLEPRVAQLAALAKGEPRRAWHAIGAFLDELVAGRPLPGEAVAAIETVRGLAEALSEEVGGSYVGRAVPLAADEEEAFTGAAALWRQMAEAYDACAPAESDESRALLLHRSLYATGRAIFEHFRARRVVAEGLWLELHGRYQEAESRNLALVQVADPAATDGRRSCCAAAFAAILLTDAASPYGLNSRELKAVYRWALRWAPLVGVLRLGEEGATPEFIVDLARDSGLHPPGEAAGTDVRRLESGRLVEAMRMADASLRERMSPGELGLGDDVSGGQCRQLLTRLARPWAQAVVPRRFRRRPATGIALVGTGFEAIHYFVSGRAFRQPEGFRVFSRSEYEELFVFRDMVEPKRAIGVRDFRDGYEPEQWSVYNESASGFRLYRAAPGQRLSHRQLLGVCPHDGEQFVLAEICWLMQDEASGLSIGVDLLAGLPQAIAARRVTGGGSVERFGQAFMLPASPTGGSGSLVLPRGWFVPGGLLEVGDDTSHFRRLRMLAVLTPGADFERVSFEFAD